MANLTRASWIVPCALLTVCGAFVGRATFSSSAKTLEARSVPRANDPDADGLASALEVVLGTNPDLVDSDGDGFSDAEEFARGALPTNASSLPAGRATSVFMATYAESGSGSIRPVAAIYVADGNLADKSLTFGARVQKSLVALGYELWGGAPTFQQPGAFGGLVLIVDWPFNSAYVSRFGSLSFYAKIWKGSVGLAAGVTNVVDSGGVMLEFLYNPVLAASIGRVPTPEIGTGMYRPIQPDSVPVDWIPGAICVQQMHTIGSAGAVVSQEVVAAGCENGFDSYCSSGCSGSVGSTIDHLDPAVLLGG